MPSFGAKSRERLATCHPSLILLFEEVVRTTDCTIIEGHRSIEAQKAAFRAGASDKDGVINRSKHQSNPSIAVDVMPSPFVMHGVRAFDDPIRFAYFAGKVMATADRMGIRLRWGGDWNDDGSTRDHRLVDMPHFELVL